MQIFRKICILLLALCCLLSVSVTTHAFEPDVNRFTFIPIEYDGKISDALPCSDGLFAIKNEAFKTGYLAADATLKIPFAFSDGGSFSAGLAPAMVANGKYGYINKYGLFEIAPAYDSANAFSDGLSLVEKDTQAFYIDATGKKVSFATQADYTPISSYHDGSVWVMDANGGYRLLRKDATFLNDVPYLWAGEFSEGVCWVSPESGDDFIDFSMQLIDANGNVLIEKGIYTSATVYKDGVCWAKRTADGKIVLIDKQGSVLFIAENAEAMPTPFANGVSVSMENGLFTLRNPEGIVLFSSLKYRAINYGGFSEGSLLVHNTTEDKYYIMRDNRYVPEEKFIAAHEFGYCETYGKGNRFEIVFRLGSPFAIVNGEKMYIDAANPNVKAFTQNDRTLIPMRFLSEHLPGWRITWDYITESAVLQSDTLSASFKDGVRLLSYIQFNPEKKQYDSLTKSLDQPPLILDGRMFLPVRALSELMEVNVFYDARGLVVFSNTIENLSEADATQLLATFE